MDNTDLHAVISVRHVWIQHPTSSPCCKKADPPLMFRTYPPPCVSPLDGEGRWLHKGTCRPFSLTVLIYNSATNLSITLYVAFLSRFPGLSMPSTARYHSSSSFAAHVTNNIHGREGFCTKLHTELKFGQNSVFISFCILPEMNIVLAGCSLSPIWHPEGQIRMLPR